MANISDITAVDANVLISALNELESMLDPDDEHLPPELLPALQKLRAKLQIVPMHTSFSKADYFSLNTAGIHLDTLFLIDEMKHEIESFGKLDAPSTLLTFDNTAELVNLIRRHVSFTTEAGCRLLIDIFLLRLASTMQSDTGEVMITPKYPLPKTLFEGASGSQSFSGVLDYLLTYAPPRIS
ncbi:hypothetical protein H0H93_016648, partial [Arthromyces matolae]